MTLRIIHGHVAPRVPENKTSPRSIRSMVTLSQCIKSGWYKWL